jgi:hypothetical protein
MKIYRAGDTGVALAKGRGKVAIEYRYRDLRLDSGVLVKDVLVGVDEKTDEVLTIPPQSTPKIKTAREKIKEKVLSVRIPCELDDVLWVVSDHLDTSPSRFTSVLVRYYLTAAMDNSGLARRLSKLSQSELAKSPCRSTLKLRSESAFLDAVKALGKQQNISTTDVVRGAVLVAFEDIVENKAVQRTKELRSIASALK